jgi:catechol-2,3-dioxygenase
MKPEIGHVVLKVRSLRVSVPFYCSVLGMHERRRRKVNSREMAFLTFGERDHDIGLLEVGASAHPHDEARAGLRHVAFRIGDRIEELHVFKAHLDTVGIEPERMTEHRFSKSIYLRDPDGLELEVYVDSDCPALDAEGEKSRPLEVAP